MLLEFIASLKENADYRDILSHYEYMPAKPVEYYEGDLDLPGPLVQALARLGISRLFSHQGRGPGGSQKRPTPPGGHAHGQRQDPDL